MIYFDIIKQLILLKFKNIENKNIFYWCLLYEAILIENQLLINYFLNKINWIDVKFLFTYYKGHNIQLIHETNICFLKKNDYNFYLTKIQ